MKWRKLLLPKPTVQIKTLKKFKIVLHAEMNSLSFLMTRLWSVISKMKTQNKPIVSNHISKWTLNVNSIRILMKGSTWGRDSHNLFDYESKHLNKQLANHYAIDRFYAWSLISYRSTRMTKKITRTSWTWTTPAFEAATTWVLSPNRMTYSCVLIRPICHPIITYSFCSNGRFHNVRRSQSSTRCFKRKRTNQPKPSTRHMIICTSKRTTIRDDREDEVAAECRNT